MPRLEFTRNRKRNDPRLILDTSVKAPPQDAAIRAWSNSWSAFSASNCAASTSKRNDTRHLELPSRQAVLALRAPSFAY